MYKPVVTRVGLIGWPVGHSRSPAMHNAAFRALSLPWEYLLLPVPPDLVHDAVRGLRGLGFAGANVTVPHKQAVMAFLDDLTEEARAVGAVNTIVNEDGRLLGYNTDVAGFLQGLREGGVEPRGSRVLVLGAGGASRAAVFALLREGAEVVLSNRSADRAAALAAELGALFGVEVPVVAQGAVEQLSRSVKWADLLVNTTSAGMAPRTDQLPLPDSIPLHSGLAVYDLVYEPRVTGLLAKAHEVGARAIGGIGMLIHQGAAAFTLWTGQAAPIDIMRDAVDG